MVVMVLTQQIYLYFQTNVTEQKRLEESKARKKRKESKLARKQWGLEPKNQISFITNFTAHPYGGLSYFNFDKFNFVGYYIDVRPTISFLNGGNYTSVYDGNENITRYGEILWTSVYNLGLSLPITNNSSKAIMIYAGMGLSRTRTYMAEYDEYNIISRGPFQDGDWWYYEDGNILTNTNINFGILIQRASKFCYQIGFDSSIRKLYNRLGLNIGIGFKIK